MDMEQTEVSKVIALEKDDARQISTSQIIASLAGACRELIDNALDAGATSIEIRTIEFGVKQLEVIDNGSGITSSNFGALCKPHSTSKLSKFEDLDSLLTFGFRGEALNALASLSELTIVTQHKRDPAPTRLKFNHDGEIIEQSTIARSIGTTVSLSNLFDRLPVRRKQFQISSKEQFQKLVSCVQSFALSRMDVRFTIKNTMGAKTTQVLATQGGNSTLKSVISNLFGSRAEKETMLEIKNGTPDNETLNIYGLSDTKNDVHVYETIKIHGFVSSSAFGCGRSSADRQFVFVNGRPVDYDRMRKVVNEVYSSFNRGHYCTLVLFVEVDPKFVDPNLTPDKRKVFLKNEKEVFAKLRACLVTTFMSVGGDCRDSKKSEPKESSKQEETSNMSIEMFTEPISSYIRPISTLLKDDKQASRATKKEPSRQKKSKSPDSARILPNASTSLQTTPIVTSRQIVNADIKLFGNKDVPLMNSTILSDDEPASKRARQFNVSTESLNYSHRGLKDDLYMDESESNPFLPKQIDLDTTLNDANPFDLIEDLGDALIVPSVDMLETTEVSEVEKRLSMMLKKEDFDRMQIVGQFNKAFILTRLDSNFFVIDQHAADEKYNFETLQQNHKVEHQPLIVPNPLELGSVYEAVVTDNEEIFRANGFEFEYDENGSVGRRLKLVSVPTIHGHMFGKSDIEEICGVLNVHPGMMYRPEKLRKIFASWSCRMSVMIGKQLKLCDMKKIVRNMGTLDNPWNCPHGRPTIRLLCEAQFPLVMTDIFEGENSDESDEESTAQECCDDTIEVARFDYDESQIF